MLKPIHFTRAANKVRSSHITKAPLPVQLRANKMKKVQAAGSLILPALSSLVIFFVWGIRLVFFDTRYLFHRKQSLRE